MKKASFYFMLLLFPFAFFDACSLTSPAIPVPSYIHIEKINAEYSPKQTYASVGTDSSNISDAWVYVNDQYIGAFQLPCTFPVLTSGTNQVVSIDAGIEVSGISAERAQYPFYAQYTLSNVTLTRGQRITISPTVTYLPSTIFAWMEDFESVSSSIVKDPNVNEPDTSVQITHNPSLIYQGKGSGVVSLTTAVPVFAGISSLAFKLSTNSDSLTYLELNYKSNNSFVIGVYTAPFVVGISVPLPAISVNPSTTWNKMYVNLSTALAAASGTTSFNVYFYMSRDSSVTLPVLYLDNIKVLHF
jgi:hypothetical protein